MNELEERLIRERVFEQGALLGSIATAITMSIIFIIIMLIVLGVIG